MRNRSAHRARGKAVFALSVVRQTIPEFPDLNSHNHVFTQDVTICTGLMEIAFSPHTTSAEA